MPVGQKGRERPVGGLEDGDLKDGVVEPLAAIRLAELCIEREERVDVLAVARVPAEHSAIRAVGCHVERDAQLVAGAVGEI